MEEKSKHLDFIQAAISRMAQNSFLIKGWTVTLVAALFALSSRDSNSNFIVITYFPTAMFWLLDGYYLHQERLFRKLYDHVRRKTTIDYNLDTTEVNKGFGDWLRAVFSKTVMPFYFTIFFVIIIATFFLT